MNKQRFNEMYALMPRQAREDLVVFLDGAYYSVNFIKQEVDKNTTLGNALLRDLGFER